MRKSIWWVLLGLAALVLFCGQGFGEGIRENPFKSAERFYPVEMPYKIDETYNLQLEVPVGYEVDEMPKPILVKLNEQNEGLFEYRVSSKPNLLEGMSKNICTYFSV